MNFDGIYRKTIGYREANISVIEDINTLDYTSPILWLAILKYFVFIFIGILFFLNKFMYIMNKLK